MTDVAVGVLLLPDGSFLLTSRPKGKVYEGYWEFPGGKLEAGETVEQALRRELCEELGATVEIGAGLPVVTHSYPDFTCTLYPFICTLSSAELTLHEHDQLTWLPPRQLHTLDWLAADVPVLAAYLEHSGR